MITFKSINNKVEVTALKFYNDVIIAGIGSFLYIFEITTGKSLSRIAIFHGQKIHGFEFYKDSLAVFGGKKLSILKINNSRIFTKDIQFSTKDWVLNIYWLDDDYLAVITANNTVLKYDLKTQDINRQVKSQENCILYNATFVAVDNESDPWENLIVLGGTVFQEIIIWSPAHPEKYVDKPILQRLKGHNGVIFNIFFDKTTQTICSTSDDRSVRVWTKKNPVKKLISIQDWENETYILTHTMFGHNARVWRCFVANNYIISIGEDSQICIWNMTSGKLLNSWKSHQGARLWSIDCNVEESLIAVGGGDGAICLWPLIDLRNAANYQTIMIPENQTAKRLSFYNTREILFVSDSGQLLGFKNNTWNILFEDERLANYALLSLSPSRQLLSLADLYGHIYIFDLSENCLKKILIQQIHNGKIFSIHWLNEEYLISCGNDGEIILWNFIINEGNFIKKQEHILPNSKERWLTCALFFENVLICGDRGGSIYVFQSQEQNPSQRYSRQHGSLGVTSICKLDSDIISLGRDGRLCRYVFQDGLLDLQNSEKLPIKWPIAVYNIKQYPYLIAGFTEDRFMAWSSQDRRILFDVPCGGGHRACDLILNENPLHFDFTYIRDSAIHHITYDLSNLALKILLPGFHCNVVHSAKIVSPENSSNVLISVGEDNVIRLTSIPQCHEPALAVLRGHLSAVRCLAIKKLENKINEYFLVTAGARGEIKTWIIHFEASNVSYTELASHMIRDCDFKSAVHLPDPESRYMDLALIDYQENLFLLAAASSDGIIRFFLTGPAKSQLQLLSSSIDYFERCILKLAVIQLSDHLILVSMSTDGKAIFWKLSTEELINDDKKLKPLLELSLHQSGINACDWIDLSKNKILFATGGDDNAFVISKINLTKPSGKILFRDDLAHLSQITGVKILKNESVFLTSSIDQRITAWNWFCIPEDTSTFQCESVKQFCSTVSDIHGFDIWNISENELGVCVYGSGIEILEVSLKFRHLPKDFFAGGPNLYN